MTDYQKWLTKKIFPKRCSYKKLLEHLDSVKFIYQLVGDRDRNEGGKNLRYHYAYYAGVYESDVRLGDASVLEVLIGISEHILTNMTEEYDMHDCFMMLLNNLGLTKFDDRNYISDDVDDILDVWLLRKYDRHGNGSLFPLKINKDCRNMTIWSQMNQWMYENFFCDDDFIR